MGTRGPLKRSVMTAPEPSSPLAPPDWLPGPAKAVWNEVEPHLRARGIMKPEYVETLAQYCAISAELRTLTATIARDGSTAVGKQGLTPSPAHSAASRLRSLLATYAKALLLDPMSFARSEGTNAKAAYEYGESELAKFVRSRSDRSGHLARPAQPGRYPVLDYLASKAPKAGE